MPVPSQQGQAKGGDLQKSERTGHTVGYGGFCDTQDCLLGLSCIRFPKDQKDDGVSELPPGKIGQCKCQNQQNCAKNFMHVNFTRGEQNLTLTYTIRQENGAFTPQDVCLKNISSSDADPGSRSESSEQCNRLDNRGVNYPLPVPGRGYSFRLEFLNERENISLSLTKNYSLPARPRNITPSSNPDGTLTISWEQDDEIQRSRCMVHGSDHEIKIADDLSNNICRFSGLLPLKRYNTLLVFVYNKEENYVSSGDIRIDHFVVPRVVKNVAVVDVGLTNVTFWLEERSYPRDVIVGFYVINGTDTSCVAFQRTPSCAMPDELQNCTLDQSVSATRSPLPRTTTTLSTELPGTTTVITTPRSFTSTALRASHGTATISPSTSRSTTPTTSRSTAPEGTATETTMKSTLAARTYQPTTPTASMSTTSVGGRQENPNRSRRDADNRAQKQYLRTPSTKAGRTSRAVAAADDGDESGHLLIVGDLQASTTYSFELTPWFCNITDVRGFPTDLGPVSTPLQVETVSASPKGGREVLVQWQSRPAPEDVTYIVYLLDALWNTRVENCSDDARLGVEERTELCSILYKKGHSGGQCSGTADLAFWEYGILIETTTKIPMETTTKSVTTKTKSNKTVITMPEAPGPVHALKAWTKVDSKLCGVDKLTDRYKLCVMWYDVCPRQRNSFISHYVYIVGQDDQERPPEKLPSRFKKLSMSDTEYRYNVTQRPYHDIVDVTPGKTYNVTVFAVSQEEQSGENFTISVNIPPVHPPPLSTSQVEEQVVKDSIDSGETTISVKVKNSDFMLGNGTVTGRGLIVTAGGTDPRKYHSLEDYDTYPGWSNRTEVLNTTGYRIREEKLEHASEKGATLTIGDKKCDDTEGEADKFCDGPLEKGTTYSVWVFVCNKEDCVSVVLINNQTTLPGPLENDHHSFGKIKNIVVAVSFCAFILICVGAAWFCCFRHKKRKSKPMDLPDWTTLQKIEKPRAQRPMRLISLENIICKKQRDDSLLLREEYEDIVQSFVDLHSGRPRHRPHNTGFLEVNRAKNRYNDIVTYDHSRVKLTPDQGKSDYINANFIPGYQGEGDFIATQGPLPFTSNDFWRMVWEHNVSIIVMLTQPKEEGRIKCEQYWPAQHGEMSEYGDIRVTNSSTSTDNDYNITNFLIENCKTQDKGRKVLHFHYLKWRDMTADVQVDSVLEFHRVVRQHAHPDKPGPIIVHCSAGVGRTGAFIAVDYIQRAIAERSMNGDLDIYGFVMRMREFRCNMVQTVDQYIFIHQCARVLMATRRKREAKQGIGRVSYAPSTSSVIFDKGVYDLVHNPDAGSQPNIEMVGVDNLAGPRPRSKVKFEEDGESRGELQVQYCTGTAEFAGCNSVPSASMEHLIP